ncbi:YEATS domain-containing protein 4 [Tyrophagus putrescentiae]|nr:YEATS domain-containing protein 4 [Tyrophagus putrescentiae]
MDESSNGSQQLLGQQQGQQLQGQLMPAADYGPRVRGANIVKPVVYGNVSRYLGATREDGHTHEWTVYLKSYENEDMRGYIRKVHFKLHDSYAEPNRIITDPPYRVSESGWGEFEVMIKVYYTDGSERPLAFTHQLKLFNTPPASTDYPLVSESYDELVFAEPSTFLYKRLVSAPPLPPALQEVIDTDFETKRKTDLESILEGKKTVAQAIEEYKKLLKIKTEALEKAKAEMAQAAQAAATATTATDDGSADGNGGNGGAGGGLGEVPVEVALARLSINSTTPSVSAKTSAKTSVAAAAAGKGEASAAVSVNMPTISS